MRVIAGRLRGRRIEAPRGDQVRPTYDRVRESVFSIIGSRVRDASVLDLFAGSGSLGIEGLSRGAARATFVEKDPRVRGVLLRNIEVLGLGREASVLGGDAARLLERGLPGAPFDLVFIDPPYASGLARETLCLLDAARDLAPGALTVVEHAAESEPDAPRALRCVRRARYGGIGVSFYEASDASDRDDKEEP